MNSSSPATNTQLIELASDIVSAYVSNNSIRAEDLSQLINTVHFALTNIDTSQASSEPTKHEAPMSWKRAIKPDFIISFEDGKHYKSMKRHLTGRGLTPAQYREKWGLPKDFPMVAPNYSAARSEMAKAIGLGRKRQTGRKAKKRGSRKAG